MKKILAFILVITMLVMTFVACNSGDPVPTEGDTEKPSDTKKLENSEKTDADIEKENNQAIESDREEDNNQGEENNQGEGSNANNNANNQDGEKNNEGDNSEGDEGGDKDELLPSSEGLIFELNEDEKSYTVVNVGECEAADIVIGSYNGLPVTKIAERAFYDNYLIESVTISSCVTHIGKGAFYFCFNLESVNFDKNSQLTDIGDEVFYYCESLAKINIPSSVTNIGRYVFAYCTALSEITVEKGNPQYHSNGNCIISTSSKTLAVGCKASIIPQDGSVTKIGDNAFSYCINMPDIDIPNGVSSIGRGAFSYCFNLRNIILPASINDIGEQAFAACTALESINIPAGVKSIGNYAFLSCTELVVSVENGNTKYCSKNNCLIDVTNKALIAGGNKSVIPSDVSIMRIEDGVFFNCRFTTITIPETVTYIGSSAFYDCSNLTEIVFNGKKEDWIKITKGEEWDSGTKEYTVKCSDGDILKSEG